MNRQEMLQKRDGVVIEKLSENEIVALNVDTGVFVALNCVSMYILKYLDEPHTIFEIIAYIRDTFDCKLDITSDIQSFINRAVDIGLIEFV